MIVAGLLAALLTYSVLRGVGGGSATVLVASRAIEAGDKVQPSAFTHATLKGSGPVGGLGLLPASAAGSLAGQVARVNIPSGQAVERRDFQPATPDPPVMTIPVSLQDLPGGVAGVPAGDLVDVLGTAANGTPVVVPGLRVVSAPHAPSAQDLAAGNDSVGIVVAVPSTATGSLLSTVLTSSKYSIRVSPPGALPSTSSSTSSSTP